MPVGMLRTSGSVISGSVASSSARSAAYMSSTRRAQWVASVACTGLPPSVAYMRSYSAWASGVAMPSAALQAAERRGAVHAGVLAVDEALPADALEVRVDEVAVRLDVLGDVREVVLGLELDELLAVGVDHADLAVVEVDLVVLVDHAHVVGLVGEGVALDQVDVGLVGEHDVVEDLQGDLGELDLARGDLDDAVALLGA